MESAQKHYLGHLTEVNKTNKVVLAEDVFNQKGVLVVKKGCEVNREFALKVAKHKLIKPIEESVALSEALTYKQVVAVYAQRLQALQLMNLVKNSDYFNDVVSSLRLVMLYPLVNQKLSVLEQRMPEVFARSLVTSGLALGLCKELKLPDETIKHVFIANMMSDIGLLHIDPAVVNKKGAYSQEEWKMMQGHVAIAKHFSDQVPDLPKIVGRALLEHHERPDGFGYPFGKKAEQLCLEGQILSVVDKVNGLVQKLVKNSSYSWKAVIDVMQVPTTAHIPEVQTAMMRLLRQIPFPYSPAFAKDEYPAVADECIKKRQRLHLWFTEFARIYVDHKDLITDTDGFESLALLKQLEYTVADSGLLNENQQHWLESLKDEISGSDFIELEEFALILNEIEYQCHFVMRKLISAEDELAKRFGGPELPALYYAGLYNILNPSKD